MDLIDFSEKAVSCAPPDVPRRAVERAVKLFADLTKREHLYVQDIPDVYRLAKEIGSPEEPLREEPIRFDVPSLEVQLEEVLAEIDPEVRELRKLYFSSGDPPFEDYPKAIHWLEQQGEKQPEPTADEQRRWRAISGDITGRCLDAAEINSTAMVWPSWKVHNLEYLRPFVHPRTGRLSSAGWNLIRVTSHSELYPLAQGLERLEEGTDLDRFSLLLYVLLGHPPELEAAYIKVRTWGDSRPDRAQVVLKLNTPHLTWDDFQVLYREVKAAWLEALPHQAFPLKHNDLLIREVVSELGGEPDPPASKEFWERARDICEAKGKRYKDWNGPLRAWQRYKRRKLPELPEGWTEDSMRRYLVNRLLTRESHKSGLYRLVRNAAT